MGRPSAECGGPGHASERWVALAALAEEAAPHATQFFSGCLALLVEKLGVDRVAMTRVASQGLETCWWALGPEVGADDAIHETDEFFSPRVLDDPAGVLAIPDLQDVPELGTHPTVRRLGIRAYFGFPLRSAETCLGVLSLQSVRPRTLEPEELAFARVAATLLSRTLESESLREDLKATRNVLDLTAAVVEDHSLESTATRLPNRRYLEIWLKAHLYLAQRRGEAMSVVQWLITPDPETRQRLHDISASLRGEDLLVDLDGREALLLLPHTGIEGAQILLERIRTVLGPVPMGATLWEPLHPVDAEDLSLQQAFLRTAEARDYSERMAEDGHAEIQWMLLQMGDEAPDM